MTLQKIFINGFQVPLIILVLASSQLWSQDLETVSEVNLELYAGKWYEIASFPMRFQEGCHCTTAEYSISPKGYVVVENRCNRDSLNGKVSYIKGKAFITKNSGNAKLKVQFFWPYRSKYWIIDRSADYDYAVVCHPNRKSLWILSRSPKMDEKTYAQILDRLQEKNFDTDKLKRTPQK